MTTTSVILKVVKFEIRDVVRSRWLLAYTIFFALVTDALLRFSSGSSQALLSLVNVILILIPLVTVIFGTTYLYNAREFTELLLAEPVSRRSLFAGLYLGLGAPLSLAFLLGICVPILLHGLAPDARMSLATLLLCGVALTFVFAGVAFLVTLRWDDRVKGLGAAIAAWATATILYDGAILVAATMFADYPLERVLLGAVLANPVDLARVILLLQFDISALMGYTGAVFRSALGGAAGLMVASLALIVWALVPALTGLRLFRTKDF